MANFIEKLGLSFLAETEEQVQGLMGYIVENGKSIVGYYGHPYLNHHFGDAQFILRVVRNEETKQFEVSGMDTHSAGRCVWDLRISQANIQRKDADILEHRCLVCRKDDDGGMAVVNVVNADVLPSFREGALIRLQMIAFPHAIDYYADEDAYLDAQPETESGKKYVLADGMVFPNGILYNRNPNSEDFEKDEDMDNLMMIRGTVKGLYHGKFELDDVRENAYLRCIIGTQFGDLEIVHPIEDIPEERRKNIRVGSVVSGVFTLSGDAAIYEYENGIILDEVHNLEILRATFAGSDPERLRYVLSEDAVYSAGYNSKQYRGRDAIIERLKYVQDDTAEYFAYPAVITEVTDGDMPLRYAPGQHCIVIARNAPGNYDAIAFAELDADGRICLLETSVDSRYRFHIEA